jgi:hypothetical protein
MKTTLKLKINPFPEYLGLIYPIKPLAGHVFLFLAYARSKDICPVYNLSGYQIKSQKILII